MRKAREFGNAKKSGVIGLILLLGGCEAPASLLSYIPGAPALPSLPGIGALLPEFDPVKCAVVSPKALKQVNWARVPQVNMRIRNDEFEPMIVQMTQGWPYTFRIRNRDDRTHAFNAKSFFTNIAMVRLTIDGKRIDDTCISTVYIPPMKTAEMQLVAAIDGHYEFSDEWQRTASFIGGGAGGVIIIEERRTPQRY